MLSMLLVALLAYCSASADSLKAILRVQNALLLRTEIDAAARGQNVITQELVDELFKLACKVQCLPGITTMLTHPATQRYIPFYTKTDHLYQAQMFVYHYLTTSPMEMQPSLAIMKRMPRQWNLFCQSVVTFGPLYWVVETRYNSPFLHVFIAHYADILNLKICEANKVHLMLAIAQDLRREPDGHILFDHLEAEMRAKMYGKTLEGAQYIAYGIASGNEPALYVLDELPDYLVQEYMSTYEAVFRRVLKPDTKPLNPNSQIILTHFNMHFAEWQDRKRSRWA